jgi:hypothetical protein
VSLARGVSRFAVVSLATLTLAAPSHATSLLHESLSVLTQQSELVLRATVLDIHSYWNADHSFILTDVHARPDLVLRGTAAGDVTFTLLGGTVGEITTLLIGGADLAPGAQYVVFLSHADLPGAAHRLTIREHAQGAFDVVNGRAISQAFSDPLLPDADGDTVVPGGAAGLTLDELAHQIRLLSNH